jgi:hypothetical protein
MLHLLLLLPLLLRQVDLFEVLYRCGRGMGEKAYRQHLDAQVGSAATALHVHAVRMQPTYTCYAWCAPVPAPVTLLELCADHKQEACCLKGMVCSVICCLN